MKRNKLRLLKKFIKESIEASQSEEGPENKNIVLVNDGSFNPVHRGHVNVTLEAKKVATSLGYKVVGLYMLLNHRSWLENKFSKNPEEIIDDEDRFSLLQDALTGTNIIADDWEIKGPKKKSKFEYKSHYESMHPGATYVMVVGSDYGDCIPMPCFEQSDGVWSLRLPRTEGLSSSKIRAAARKEEDMSDYTFDSVRKFMKAKRTSSKAKNDNNRHQYYY